ncbi:peroxidase 44-like [Abrus precatorius]|uniref:Peroxidase n=1 Tax=Abrus precatorius TaxID=3816 RepID=A0A8B8LXC2_ABRPR|nr:peroxidase 44-like [Abrus precatorius]
MKIINIILILFCVLSFALGDLIVGYYDMNCPMAENIVHDVVRRYFLQDASITGGLLRMHFHDCFVTGCDASILIDPTNETSSEKNAGPNLTVRGYEIIDEAKTLLEESCPLTVSCADIITLAARDAVGLAGGPIYLVPTGRKDGLISNPKEVNLPGPYLPVSQALEFFTAKNMSLDEMVTLLGAHTLGFAHCSSFRNRLSSFSGHIDPTMDPALDANLVRICGSSSTNTTKDDPTAVLDATPNVFDNTFYGQLFYKRGVLSIDQQLALDPLSRDIASRFSSDGSAFRESFANAMVKLGYLAVDRGDIRKNCRVFN